AELVSRDHVHVPFDDYRLALLPHCILCPVEGVEDRSLIKNRRRRCVYVLCPGFSFIYAPHETGYRPSTKTAYSSPVIADRYHQPAPEAVVGAAAVVADREAGLDEHRLAE